MWKAASTNVNGQRAEAALVSDEGVLELRKLFAASCSGGTVSMVQRTHSVRAFERTAEVLILLEGAC